VKKTALLTALVVVAGAISASAATITYQIKTPTATTWQLVASSSSGDNAGIYSFGFDIKGITSFGIDPINSGDSGFAGPLVTFFRSPSTRKTFGFYNNFNSALDPTSILASATTTVKTAQGLADPSLDYVYGLGQAAGNSNTLAPPTSPATGWSVESSNAYVNPAVLFQGERPAGGQVVVSNLNGAVFISSNSGAGANLNIAPSIIAAAVPEPASIALIAMGAIGLAVAAKRRRTA